MHHLAQAKYAVAHLGLVSLALVSSHKARLKLVQLHQLLVLIMHQFGRWVIHEFNRLPRDLYAFLRFWGHAETGEATTGRDVAVSVC